jgi:hypothetical protein
MADLAAGGSIRKPNSSFIREEKIRVKEANAFDIRVLATHTMADIAPFMLSEGTQIKGIGPDTNLHKW